MGEYARQYLIVEYATPGGPYEVDNLPAQISRTKLRVGHRIEVNYRGEGWYSAIYKGEDPKGRENYIAVTYDDTPNKIGSARLSNVRLPVTLGQPVPSAPPMRELDWPEEVVLAADADAVSAAGPPHRNPDREMLVPSAPPMTPPTQTRQVLDEPSMSASLERCGNTEEKNCVVCWERSRPIYVCHAATNASVRTAQTSLPTALCAVRS